MHASDSEPIVIRRLPIAGAICWGLFAVGAWAVIYKLWPTKKVTDIWPVVLGASPFLLIAVVMSVGMFLLPRVVMIIRPGGDLTLTRGPWCGLWPRERVIPIDQIASVRHWHQMTRPGGGNIQHSHFLLIVLKDGTTHELLPSGFLPWRIDRFAGPLAEQIGVPYEKQLDDPPISGPAIL